MLQKYFDQNETTQLKRKKFRIFAVMLIILLTLTGSPPSFIVAKQSNHLIASNSIDAFSRSLEDQKYEQNAIEISNKLYDFWGTLGFSEGTDYPKDFGGSYIEGKYLIVNVVSDYDSKYYSILNDENDVIFRTVDYSYNDLLAAFDKVNSSLGKWHSSLIDIVQNRIIIEYPLNDTAIISAVDRDISDFKLSDFNLADGEWNNELHRLSSVLDLDMDAISVFTSDELDMITCTFSLTVSPERELWGGDKITRPSSTPGYVRSFTLGATGYYKNKPAILTTIHSTEVGDIVSYSGSRIGPVVYSEYRNGDYSIVELNNTIHHNVNKYFGPADSVNAPITISGTNLSFKIGTTVYKYGYKSGWAILKITAVDYKANYNGTEIIGLVRTSIVAGTSQSGDSGGPYFSYDSTQDKWFFVGIHSGGNGTTHTNFTRWNKITTDFRLLF